MRPILIALLCAIELIGSLPPAAASESDLLYLTPQRLIDIGGFRLNLVCAGAGSPTVLFDAGLEDWSPAWSKVQPAIATVTRACAYDRAGNGWSDPGPTPRTSARIVDELQRLLHAAHIAPPYLIVGHSFGGYNMRLFADRYVSDVAGIVLVDSSHEDQEAITRAESPHADAEWATFLAQLRHCRALAQRGAVGRTLVSQRDCAGQFFRGLPEREFSARLNAVLLREAQAPKQYAASLSEAENFNTRSAAELRSARRPFGAVPLRILTAAHHFVDTPRTSADVRRREARFERGWQALQRSWLSLSSNARQTVARSSGHYVQLDQPELVIAAIRDEIALARASARRRSSYRRTASALTHDSR